MARVVSRKVGDQFFPELLVGLCHYTQSEWSKMLFVLDEQFYGRPLRLAVVKGDEYISL
jgi:hypothetical protein